MASGHCTFKQTDVTRALRAAIAAGVDVRSVEIHKDGRIVVTAGKPQEPADEGRGSNEWDRI
jgi:hypothetical protein